MKIIEFFKKAFKDMKNSAKEQHKVDKANFEAVKAESRANWEEAKMSPSQWQHHTQEEREKQIAEAEKRKKEAEARIAKAKNIN